MAAVGVPTNAAAASGIFTPPPMAVSFFALVVGTASVVCLIMFGLYAVLLWRTRPAVGVQAAPCPDRWIGGRNGKCYGAKSNNTGRLARADYVQSFQNADWFWKKRWAEDNGVLWAGF